MKKLFLYLMLSLLGLTLLPAQTVKERPKEELPRAVSEEKKKKKVYYGIASYYAEKFNGRPTANGEIYDGKKLTAACNILPLGTWIRVTNLRNNKSVIVKTNDRLHPRMKRIVDLSRTAAEKLGFIKRGLTQVKVEILEKKKGR